MILGTSPIASNLHTGTLINFFVFVGLQISAIEGQGTKRSRTLEARMHQWYPEGFRQPLAFNAEGQGSPSRWPRFCRSFLLLLLMPGSSGTRLILLCLTRIIFLCCVVRANLSLWLWNLVVRWIRDLPLTEFTGVRLGLTTSYEFNYPGKHHF